MNRTFHPDDFPTWISEVQELGGRQVTDGPTMDALYERYLANQTPLLAAVWAFGESARERARQPHVPLRPEPVDGLDGSRGCLNAGLAIAVVLVVVGLLAYARVWL